MSAKKRAEKHVEVKLNLGRSLKASVQKAARASGVTVNEFICDTVQSAVRRNEDYEYRETFVRHGGKHLMGKHTGYEVTPEGKYYPSPSWVQQFEQLFTEEQAIHSLVNSVVAVAQERLIVVRKRISEAKDSLIDDLGLDKSKSWVFYGASKNYLEEFKEKSMDEAATGGRQ